MGRSIISRLRGGPFRRRKSSNRIRYREALQALKAYQNSELELVRMIDNYLFPSKSLSCNCQLDGCHQRIRYEYVMRSKITKDIVVVGSTCVWIMLGLSEEEIKKFEKIESSIKDFHKMIEWRKNNMDVWDKLMQLKKSDLKWFQPFWEEVEYSPLCDEDTNYIRSIDVDREIQKEKDRLERKNRIKNMGKSINTVGAGVVDNPFSKLLDNIESNSSSKSSSSSNSSSSNSNSNSSNSSNSSNVVVDENYNKMLGLLDVLVRNNPSNDFLLSLKSQSDKGKILTKNQLNRIKVEVNYEYYRNTIKGTSSEVEYNSCDDDIKSLFRNYVDSKKIHIYYMDIDNVNSVGGIRDMIYKYRRQFDTLINNGGDDKIKRYWKYFRIKNEIILK